MFYSGVSHVPVVTASKTIGVSKQRIYQLIASGALLGIELDGVRLVSQQAIEDYVFIKEKRSERRIK